MPGSQSDDAYGTSPLSQQSDTTMRAIYLDRSGKAYPTAPLLTYF